MRIDQLRYEPDRRQPFGYWRCDTCGAYADAEGDSVHLSDCSVPHYYFASSFYHFGPVEVNQVKLVGYSIGWLTFELYCLWRAEGNERPDLGDLDVTLAS